MNQVNTKQCKNDADQNGARKRLTSSLDAFKFTFKTFGTIPDVYGAFIFIIFITVIVLMLEGIGLFLLVPLVKAISPEIKFSEFEELNSLWSYFEGLPLADVLKIIAFSMAITAIIRGIAEYAYGKKIIFLQYHVSKELTALGYSDLITTDLAYLQRYKVGEVSTYLNNYPSVLGGIIVSIASILRQVITILFYLAISLVASPKFSLISLALLVATSLIMKKIFTSQLNAGNALAEVQKSVGQACSEIIHWMKQIRLSAGEELALGRVNNAVSESVKINTKIQRANSISSPVFTATKGMFVAAFLLLWNYLYGNQGESMLGIILVFGAVFSRLAGPVSALNQYRLKIISSLGALDGHTWFINEIKNHKQENGTEIFSKLNKSISFENVNFTYDSETRNQIVLNDLNITISKGSFTALVGPSGGGKSTIVSLIPRLYDLDSGSIKIDGTDIRSFDLASLRRRIGFVGQEGVMFHDTILNNIRFSVPDATPEDVRAVAKAAGAAEFIDALPEGYNTIVGEQGGKLSGGQRQRLSIARALLQKPDILILDESTNQLDTTTEKIIQSTLENLRGKYTIIVIAHRLSTIKSADRIIVISNGKIVEEGNHTDLEVAKGEYWKLLNAHQLDLIDIN